MKALSKIQVLAIAAVFAVGGLVGEYTASTHAAAGHATAAAAVAPASVPMMPTTFAPVVKQVLPAVVNIASTMTVHQSKDQMQVPDDFFGQMFPGFRGFQTPQQPQKEEAEGSGVIVSSDGYVLTNNHVVDGATEVKVTLADKREMKATVIGTDPKTDVALIKLDATNLPYISLGDSNAVEVGDIALAIGNPFGLGQTVTMGIISAKDRGRDNPMGIEDYEDFIQTDAPINPGNSGGALVNDRGELIGINTAIIAHGSEGSQGIGFAVPANLAHSVMDSLIKNGKVSRGFLGIALQPLSDELAKEFKLDGSTGALVAEVTSKSPAEKAGIEAGDVVVAVNDKKVEGPRELQLLVAAIAPGTKVDVKLIRDGKEKTVNVLLGERPTRNVAANDQPEGKAEPDVLDGVTVGDINAETRKQFELPDNSKGVVITEIDPDSPSAEAGLKVGDVIHEINREPITSAKDAVDLSEKLKQDKKVLLRVSTKGSTRYVVVESKD
jgi:serine protease Do